MTARRASRRSRALVLPLVLCLAAALALVACDEEPRQRPPGKGGTASNGVTTLTFGVWGPPEEIRAYQRMVDDYNGGAEEVHVRIRSWPDSRAMMAELEDAEEAPDLFMITRSALADIRDAEMNTPLLDLLDERGVTFGDGYYRDAIEAFSADSDLQCMPYGVSPMVMYYNTELVDFDRMRARDLPAPDEDDNHERWSFEEFQAAADFATRPRRKSRGLYVEPSLEGLAPFVYAAGGQIYNDDSEPTGLAFSEGGTRDALTDVLEVLRNPQISLTDRQLARRAPIEWFKRGRLGMIPGYRDLTPELRAVPNLDFDVMPMPSIRGSATIGDFTGLCISSESPAMFKAADFLVHVIGEEAFAEVTDAGYLAPANLDVATSDVFLQPGKRPAHAGVFNASVGRMVLQPLIEDHPALERAVQGYLLRMFRTPVLDLDELTTEIDGAAREVLDPDYEPEETEETEESESPSVSPSESPSEPDSE